METIEGNYSLFNLKRSKIQSRNPWKFDLTSTNGENTIHINNPDTGTIMFTTENNLEFISICDSKTDDLRRQHFKYNTVIP